MQKLKVILVNLILFLILFHVVDFFCSTINFQYRQMYENYNGLKIVQYIKKYKLQHKYSIKFDEKLANEQILTDKYCNRNDASPKWGVYRPIENKNAKNSILIFGCSFAYGEFLSNKKTFSYRLGEILPDYVVYNRAQKGWSTSHMLYQLENKDFSGMKNLKYVIYVFMDDHFCRNYDSHISILTPYYKLDNSDDVKHQKYSIKYVTCPFIMFIKDKLTAKMQYNLYFNPNEKKAKHAVYLTKNIILASKKLIDEKYKDTTFIVFRYDDGKYDPYNKMFEELKEKGLIVVSVVDLANKEYKVLPYQISATNNHPNEKAWSEITPLFVKYMQDKGYLKTSKN